MKASKRPRVHIAVMGVTGSGKSTFVQVASGIDAVEVGHKLHSCTTEVSTYDFTFGGYDITLIDTPGFNDTTRSETEVLKEIADWLDATYRNPPYVRLAGIVYLHSITDIRFLGSTMRNLKMFRKLCGEKPLRNVVLATTCWNKEDLQVGEEREEELRLDPDFWQPMLQHGSRMGRFTDRDSAIGIIMDLVKQNPVVLQIQHELVDEDKALVETAAGVAVDEELRKLEQEHRDKLKSLDSERKEALANRDEEWQEIIKTSTQALERQLARVQHEQDMLRYERRNEQRKLQGELDAQRISMRRELEEERKIAANERASEREERAKTARERMEEKRDFEVRLQAQKFEDEKHFEQIVVELRANENRLRLEERNYLEAQIWRLEQQPHTQNRGTSLLTTAFGMLGNVTMSLLGFPLLGDPIGGILSEVFDG